MNYNNNNNNNILDSFIPIKTIKDLTTINEASEGLLTPMKEFSDVISPIITIKSPKNDRLSPEVQVLDITDLNDPGVRIISKFSFKDIENKFNITIYGKIFQKNSKLKLYFYYRC
jgi:hypothetical protein